MGFFNKLFGFSQQNSDSNRGDQPKPLFGHYSDNNKSVSKTNNWYKADDLFKEKKYFESITTFFDYLSDDILPNVQYTVKADNILEFELFQGSKHLKGHCNSEGVYVEVKVAQMSKLNVPVMRKLLELNHTLYYSRCALKDDTLYMMMNSDLETSNPNKMYYGLKEIAIKADRYDDLLTQDFSTLNNIENAHVQPISDKEFTIKHTYFVKWINETLAAVEKLNQDTYAGGIAYMLLALIQRLDCALIPEGKLLREIDKIAAYYWSNEDESTAVEVNKKMIEGFKQLAVWDKNENRNNLFHSLYTFSFVQPVALDKVNETILASLNNMLWYKDNKHLDIANSVLEYGLTYAQYSYSLQKPFTQFIELFMQINYNDFYSELGLPLYYNKHINEFDAGAIKSAVHSIIAAHKEKYPLLQFSADKLIFTDLILFNKSYVEQCHTLNFNSK